MAIRLNLYHQVLRAKREKQYDPLKISFLSLLVVGVGLVGYYVFELKMASSAKSTESAKKAEFAKLGPLAKAAKEREVELTKEIELAERLTRRIEKRFYWAPVFESLVATVPPNVQVTKLSGDIKGGDPSRDCHLLLDGLAAGSEPRASAEELRKALVDKLGASYASATAVFRNLDDGAEQVRMGGKLFATSVFTIQISFKTDVAPPPVEKPAVERIHRPLAQTK